jgi:hypothetical protein
MTTQQAQLETDETTEALQQLGSRRAAERQRAEQVLKSRGADAVGALVAVLEAENRKKGQRFWTGLVLACAALGVIGGILREWWHGFNLGGAYYFVGVAAGVALASTRRQKAAARLLAECDDLRAVGPLVGALERQDAGTRAAARTALVRQLPRLRPADAHLLDETQRACLHRALAGKDAELAHAILAALQQVGDARAIPAVEKLAAGKGAAAKDGKLRQEAIDCLPVLRERAEEERVRQTLLRPASEPEGGDTLLRPAAGAGDVDEGVLLRPVDEEEAPGD